MEYEPANAMPLKAREAMRGSPSPWKVFARMPQQARKRAVRERVSVEERVEAVEDVIGVFRTTIIGKCENVESAHSWEGSIWVKATSRRGLRRGCDQATMPH